MKTLFQHMGASRLFWAGILFICLGLEGGALFFQHVLGANEDGVKVYYQPCELCIYTRVWLGAMMIVSILALITLQFKWPRRLLILAQSLLTIGLSLDVINLMKVEYQLGDGGACQFKANFWSFAPLDVWMPHMFEVKDMCQATPKIIGPISMMHGLSLVCIFLLIILSISIWQEWKNR